MTRILITRRNPRTGRLERPWRNRDGDFVLGDPARGALKHHERFATKVKTLQEVLDLVRQGFSLRMTDGDSPPALITPGSLEVHQEEGEESPDLWSSTLPKAPFGKDEMFAELKVALLIQANQIAHVGRRDYAVAFIGFETDSVEPYCEDDPEKVDLSRFHATGYLDQAYDYAFQVGQYWDFDADNAQRLHEFIHGANPRSTRGDPSPLAALDSLCRRTADMAYARWKLTFDGPLSIRELALLADMKESAVRNSLSKERIAVEDGHVDGLVAAKWLSERRDFIPTRTDDGKKERWATYARSLLQSDPLPQAFQRLLKGCELSETELAIEARVSEDFIGRIAAGAPSCDIAALRRVAEVLNLDAPHFVGIAVETALRGEAL